jgi:hypothetical protein
MLLPKFFGLFYVLNCDADMGNLFGSAHFSPLLFKKFRRYCRGGNDFVKMG